MQRYTIFESCRITYIENRNTLLKILVYFKEQKNYMDNNVIYFYIGWEGDINILRLIFILLRCI
ncbi:hypothetical protein LH29_10515 [Draconibacterium sediminis]|uniref:Uncharacterized protein n=1 Tax=Draconibacterium sediminis TaxID=1544798 RepID=A0A0D8J9X9_9BACT|nr:hypothetical protein LH29_10515 [Draconibacterium sediminis]